MWYAIHVCAWTNEMLDFNPPHNIPRISEGQWILVNVTMHQLIGQSNVFPKMPQKISWPYPFGHNNNVTTPTPKNQNIENKEGNSPYYHPPGVLFRQAPQWNKVILASTWPPLPRTLIISCAQSRCYRLNDREAHLAAYL